MGTPPVTRFYPAAVLALAAVAGAVALWLTTWWLALADAALVLLAGAAVTRLPWPGGASGDQRLEPPEPPIKQRPYHPLSAREFEVAKMACEGLRNREIAERLFVVEDTVENHLQHAYNKLGLAGGNPRMQLCGWLREKGLV